MLFKKITQQYKNNLMANPIQNKFDTPANLDAQKQYFRFQAAVKKNVETIHKN